MTTLFRAIFLMAFFIFANLTVSAQTLTLESFGSPSQTDELLSTNAYTLSRGGVMDVHEASGISVYAWAEPDNSGAPSGNRNIYCAVYDKNMNMIKSAFLVNANTTGDQYQPAIEVNQVDNTFIVAWASNHGTDGQYDIYAKKVNLYVQNTTTVATQTDHLINSNYTNLRQLTPKIAYDYVFDEVIIAWRDEDGQDGSGTGVYARRFSNLNFPTAEGTQFLVNQVTADNQVLYEVEVSATTGAFYASYSAAISGVYDAYTRRFNRNTNGTFTAVNEVRANTTTANPQYNPVFAFNKVNGKYTVSWTSEGQDGSGKGVYFRVYDKTDVALTGEIRASIPTNGDQYNVRTAWDEESDFLMHAYSYTSGSTTRIKYQLFDHLYATSGSETDAISNTNLVYNGCYFTLAYDQNNKKFRLCYQLYTTGTDLGKTQARYFTYSHPSYVPPTCLADNTKNWTSQAMYDQDGNKVQEQRTYMDQLGRTIQVQARNFEQKNTLATATLYDKLGRPAIQTLPAPINSPCLGYKSDFVTYTNTGTSFFPYTFGNFDNITGFGSVINPSPVGDNTGLGWYYSLNNTADQQVPISTFPYTRTYINELPGGVVRQTSPGQDLKMGSGKEVKTFTAPILNELDHYMTLRNTHFVTNGSSATTLANKGIKTIQVDENGIESIVFQDHEGKVLAKAMADGTVNTRVKATLTPPAFYSYTYTAPVGSGALLYIVDAKDAYEVYDFTMSSLYVPGLGFPVSVPSGHKVQIRSKGVFRINGINLTTGLPFTSTPSHNKPLVYPGNPIYPSAVDIYIKETQTIAITGSNDAQLLITNADASPSATYIPVYEGAKSGFSGVLTPGFYRIRITSLALAQTYTLTGFSVEYDFKYNNFSYYFYDNVGNLVAEVAPNSLIPVAPNGINSASTANPVYKTTYTYTTLHQTLSKNDLDAGLTHFVYRKDGNIRFSQNAKQALNGNFSYTNYDGSARVVETGEYKKASGTLDFETHQTYNPANTNSVFTALESIADAGGLGAACACRTEKSEVLYDVPDAGIPLSPTIPVSRSQKFVNGRPSLSSNADSKTWYSYDELGRTVWTIQHINGLGYKTTDYHYNLNGNVLKVIYQDATTERFEHKYTYDKNQRLKLVETKAAAGPYQVEEKYTYYLHGPLKRRELAGNLQGIDYTYTIQGWLKAINSPELDNTDPGLDGYAGPHATFAQDAFGMLLEYYNPTSDVNALGEYGKYGRCNKGLNNSAITTSGVTDLYNGTIKAMRWQTRGQGIGGEPLQYALEYDKKYQLKKATFGTVARSTHACAGGTAPYYVFTANNNFKVDNLQYDHNGNILNKYSTNNTAVYDDKFDYNYTTNTNRLASVQLNGTSNFYAHYQYNELGQLKQETKGTKVNVLDYNSYGLTTKVTETSTGTKLVAEFTYNEMGYRICKKSYNGSGVLVYTTYYVHDLSGNVLSIYDDNDQTHVLAQKEVPIYGMTRIGVAYKTTAYTYTYELTDHLGNVRAVINRTKISGQVDLYSWRDYYPHGSVMPSRAFNSNRHDYQGQYAERDDETGYHAFELRMYDARIGRWLIPDPFEQYWSPYMAMGNDPMSIVDPTGGAGGPSVGGGGGAPVNPVGGPGGPDGPNNSFSGPPLTGWNGAGGSSFGNRVWYVTPTWNDISGVFGADDYLGTGQLGDPLWELDAGEVAVSPSGFEISDWFEYENLYAIPVFGPAAEAGDMFDRGDYLGSAATFALGVTDLFFFGQASAYRNSARAGGAAAVSMAGGGSRGGTRILSQFASSTLDAAAELTMKQKGTHIFAGKLHPKPYLDQLANQLGGRQNLVRAALENANGRFPSSGVFELPVNVAGTNLTIRGFINDGKPILNTIF